MTTYRFRYLSEDGWVNGEAPSKFAAGEAQYEKSPGIDPYRSPGSIKPGYLLSSIGTIPGSGTATNIIPVFASVSGTVSRYAFIWADSGRLVRVNQSDNTVTDLTSGGAITVPVSGLEFHKDYVYYSRQGYVGRYGPVSSASPTFDNGFMTGLTTTRNGVAVQHPLKSFNGLLYVGDDDELKSLTGAESTGTTGTVAFTVATGMSISALGNLGSLLLIGTQEELNLTAAGNRSQAEVIAWNGSDSAATDIYQYPEPIITSIKQLNGTSFAFGRYSAYKLSGNDYVPFVQLDKLLMEDSVDVYGGMLWFHQLNGIRTYGTPDPALPTGFATPLVADLTYNGVVLACSYTKAYVTAGSDIKACSASGFATSCEQKSRFKHFGELETIEEIRVCLDGNMSATDDIRIGIYDETGTRTEVGTLSYSGDGGVNYKVIRAEEFSNGLSPLTGFQLGIKFNATTLVGVREVVVITKAVSQN